MMNENVWISIKIKLKFVAKGSVVNKAALIQVALCQTRNKALPDILRYNAVWLGHNDMDEQLIGKM